MVLSRDSWRRASPLLGAVRSMPALPMVRSDSRDAGAGPSPFPEPAEGAALAERVSVSNKTPFSPNRQSRDQRHRQRPSTHALMTSHEMTAN